MDAMRSAAAVLVLIVGLAAMAARADDWTPVAKDQGVELDYQAAGNLARLRFTNRNHEAMTVTWDLKVQLANGKTVDNHGDLQLAGGTTETVASTPFHDAGGPQEVRTISGVIHAKR